MKILCLSYYFSTDRILLYTDFLSELAQFAEPAVWCLSIEEEKFPADNPNAKYFERMKGRDAIPHWLNLLRHFGDYVWDAKGLSKSRDSMWRLRKAGNVDASESASRKIARFVNRLGRRVNLDPFIERLMLRYGYCDQSLADFESNRPDAVIAMVPFTPLHMSIVSAARKAGIPAICYITSWDNITTKSRLTFEYDGYLVWSETMKQELLRFHPQSRTKPIQVVGAPQYDIFRDESFHEGKEEFVARHGLDGNKKTVLYCLGSPNFIREDYGVLAFLESMPKSVAEKIQIVVRMHPGFYEHDYQVLPELRKKYPHVVFQGNKKYFDKHPIQPVESIVDWVNTFRHVDVVINLASTVAVDAAIFDKPIININFDAQPGAPDTQLIKEINSSWNHFRPVAESGGVWNVDSVGELIEAVDAYLGNPELHREGRRSIVDYVCGPIDGGSAQRMAKAVETIVSTRKSRRSSAEIGAAPLLSEPKA